MNSVVGLDFDKQLLIAVAGDEFRAARGRDGGQS